MGQLLRQQRRVVVGHPALHRPGLSRARLRCDYSHDPPVSEGRAIETRCPCFIKKCSTIGPSERAGKKVSAPTMTTVPTSRPTNNPPWVGSVPLVIATRFFAARVPATAIRGSRNRKRPMSVARPSVRLYQGELALMPANALPLLPVALV